MAGANEQTNVFDENDGTIFGTIIFIYIAVKMQKQ